MKTVHAWDLFDTLIGRKCGAARRLFEQMGYLLDDAQFADRRQAAERRLQEQGVEYSLEDIYAVYFDLFGKETSMTELDSAALVKMEWGLELGNVFKIKRYADRLRDDDIIISDMYLSEQQLRALLEKAGIPFKGRIFVSCYGKHSGQVWNQVKAKVGGNIRHIGDNRENDLCKPRKYGIITQLAETGMSTAERFYAGISIDLANWVRWQRLEQLNSDQEKLHFLEIEYNVPFLWAASHLLADYARQEKVKHLLFMSRDGQLFQRMFNHLYPEIKTSYLYISRECLRGGSESYFKYLNKLYTKDTLLVDLAASCGSLKSALTRLKVKHPHIWCAIFLESFGVELGEIRCGYATTNLRTTINNSALEMLNYATHWHVADVDEIGAPVFDEEGEYEMEIVEGYHELVGRTIETAPALPPSAKAVFPQRAKERGDLGEESIWEVLNYGLVGIHQERAFLKTTFPRHIEFERRRKSTKVFTGREQVIVMGAVKGYNWAKIQTWWKSLKLSGFEGEIHLLVYGADRLTMNQMRAHGIQVHDANLTGQLVVDRFRDAARLAWKLAADTWVVFADVGDIVFQNDPAEFLAQVPQDKSIVAASEGVTFAGNAWARDNLRSSFPEWFELMADELLYNAGSMAVRAGTLAKLGEDIYQTCEQKPQAQKHDQAAFNILLRDPRYQALAFFTKADGGWCFNAASSLFANPVDRQNYMDELPCVERGKCHFKNGLQPVMFHHYTRHVGVRRAVEKQVEAGEKYG